MLVENVSHDAINEAYVLLTAYIREDGRLPGSYDKKHLKECVKFLYEILNNPKNFQTLVIEDTGDEK